MAAKGGPAAVGSLAEMVVVTARPTTVAEVKRVFTEEAGGIRANWFARR